MNAFTYIIYSNKHDKFYVGSTNNFEDRILRHNKGGSVYTSKYIPWIPALAIKKESLSEARILENKLKRLNKTRIKQFIEKYSNDNV